MQKVDLNKVLEALINEERDEATGLVHEWIVQLSGQVHESLMAEEDADSIETDQDAIEAEEFYDAEDADGAEAEAGAEFGAEAPADDAGAMPADTVEVNVADLETMMANLHTEFAALMAGEPLGGDDATGDMDMDPAADGEMDADIDAPVDADADLDIEEPAVEGINVVESDEADEDADEVEESIVEEGDFNDLDESFNLDESTLPAGSPDSDDAEAVVIKSTGHTGHEREAAPGTKKPVTPKGAVGNAAQAGKTVKKAGDTSAMLNKKTGFGSDSPQSPLSGLKKGK